MLLLIRGRLELKKIKLKFASRRDDQRIGILFVSPFIIGFLFIFVRLIVEGVGYAFSNLVTSENGLTPEFIGLENFNYILRVDPNFTTTLLNTFKEMLTLIPMILLFSLFVAVLLSSKIYLKTFFRAIFFLPVMITSGIVSKLDSYNAVMSYMNSAASAGEESGLNSISVFLQSLEFSPSLINFVSGAAENITEIVTLSGVQILLFIAAIQSISPSIYEAADVEGATGWEKFWKITLPMVLPVGLVCLFYTVIDYLVRDTTSIMQIIQQTGFSQGNFGRASSMALVYSICVIILIALCVAVFMLIKKIINRERIKY